jgi:hypothetical protein
MNPTTMTRPSAVSLATVKTMAILAAHLTLKQLIAVRKAEKKVPNQSLPETTFRILSKQTCKSLDYMYPVQGYRGHIGVFYASKMPKMH